MTRGEFVRTAGATALVSAVGRVFGGEAAGGMKLPERYVVQQAEIDAVTPADFAAWCEGGEAKFPALRRLDAAFGKVLKEVRETSVTERPAIWFVYNMGMVVKTPQVCFSIDLKHPRAVELAPHLDFALITHNHDDHHTEAFYRAMNGVGKTVVSNFLDNYGAMRAEGGFGGGYTRAEKTFVFRDVEIRTSLADHNAYLADFTTAFEIRIGEFVIYHTGDCSSVKKLNPTRTPDVWVVHPYCGLAVADGVAKFHPKLTAIAHLNELGHARDRWRWTYAQGFEAAEAAKAAGGEAIVPVWGDRLG